MTTKNSFLKIAKSFDTELLESVRGTEVELSIMPQAWKLDAITPNLGDTREEVRKVANALRLIADKLEASLP